MGPLLAGPAGASPLAVLPLLAALLARLPDERSASDPASASIPATVPGLTPTPDGRPPAGPAFPDEGTASELALPASQTAAENADPAGEILRHADHPNEPQPAAVVRAAREAAAELVFKPAELADYDLVVALPLLAQQQPVPARLAVTSRTTPSGQRAWWLRVDAALSALGPISVRLSGAEGGPIAITIAASAHGGAIISSGLADLAADLDALGIQAGIRVTELDHG